MNVLPGTEGYFKAKLPMGTACCQPRRDRCCFKYIQPPRPLPCKPAPQLHCSDIPLERNTVHILSYQPVDAEMAKNCRPPACNPHGVTKPSEAPVEHDTVTSLSYLWVTQPTSEPIRARNNLHPLKGSLSCLTTQRHDFTPKRSDRPEPCIPQKSIHPIEARMSDKTIMMESYQPVQGGPPQSCKPENKYCPPEFPLESRTVHQLSYQRPGTPRKQIFPWMIPRTYKSPEFPFDGDTIYNGSYLAPGNFVSTECPPEESNNECECDHLKASEGL